MKAFDFENVFFMLSSKKAFKELFLENFLKIFWEENLESF